MRIKRVPWRGLVLLALVLPNTAGLSQTEPIPGLTFTHTPTPAEDSLWYYEIGGARAITRPANPRVNTVTVDASIELGLGYSCGKFDPVLSVSNILNDIARGAENMMKAMVMAARAAIANLPAYILQRANPGLYDLFQNALLKAEETVNLVTKTCEQMEYEMAQGKDPYREWVVLSKGNDWKLVMGTGGDIVEARDQVEGNNGRNGIPWLGGRQGGENQEPIQVVGDTVKAGYNVTLNRHPNADGSATGEAAETHLAQTWADPEVARAWAVKVLGDLIVRTCEDCEPSGIPGTGALPEHDRTRLAMEEQLIKLVDGTLPPTLDNLEPVSAPGTGITRGVIEALQDLPKVDREIFISKLAGEISQARLIDRLLLLRRLLLAGRQVPEIAAAQPAQREIDRKLAELDREIENLLFDTRVRKEVVSDTVAMLLRVYQDRNRESLGIPVMPAIDSHPIELDGSVKKD
jgi:integrating conjugative element protein (TIGR03755 family)